jgi:hypothetical protein
MDGFIVLLHGSLWSFVIVGDEYKKVNLAAEGEDNYWIFYRENRVIASIHERIVLEVMENTKANREKYE